MNANFQKLYDWHIAQTPANYFDLSIEEKIELTSLAIRGRFATTYVIPQDVLVQILKWKKSLRRINRCLKERHPQITNYILREIDEIPEEHFQEFRVLVKKAISAFHAGHFEASQSLATVVLDSFANQIVGRKIVTKIKHEFPKPVFEDLKTFQPYYAHAVLAPISAAFSHTTKLGAYSRNMTVHSASLSTINQLNALKAITLVSSLYLLTFYDPTILKTEF
jgi:hypothetical protein